MSARPKSPPFERHSEFLDAVVRSLADPVFVLDEDGRYVDAFGGAARREYDSLQYLVGRSLHDVMPGPLADGFLADVRRVIEAQEVHLSEYTLSAADCEGNPNDGPSGVQWFQGRIAPIPERTPEGRRCVAWAIVNISRRKQLEAELDRLARTDALTGLVNRRAFLERTGAWLDEAHAAHAPQRLQLALIDLDHFKRVNDRYGHLVGDALLEHVARVMVADGGDNRLLARVGGEEFALAMRDAGLDDALRWLERFAARLRDGPLRFAGETIATTFSAGVTSARPEDRHPADLLRDADVWLYAAKDAGRDRVAYAGWNPAPRTRRGSPQPGLGT